MHARRLSASMLALASLALAGCGEDERFIGDADASKLVVRARPGGRIDLLERTGRVILRGGWAEASFERDATEQTLSTRDCASGWQVDPTPLSSAALFAKAEGMSFECAVDGVTLRWRVARDAGHDTALSLLRLENHTSSELRVLRLTPLVSQGADAGLFVGDEPARLRILDNGSNVAADVDAKLHYAGEKRNSLVGAILPIESRGDVVSNWNHAIVDLDSERSFVAGALGVERAMPTLGTHYVEGEAPLLAGHEGLEFVADNALDFNGKLLSAGEGVESEAMYFAPLAPDPWSALEGYADAVAAWQGFTPWTSRGDGRRVPNGWNSWTGSSGTGGLGTDIDEQSMGENLDVMAREFAPFGVDYFQVDDGYQVAHGDWTPRPDRFPSGMPAWSARVEQKGLRPGLWLSAFVVDDSSELANQHPDWLAKKEDNVVGALLSPGANQHVLDLSDDAVVAWLGDTLHRYKDDWRMQWIKLDFAYLALPYLPKKSPKLTSIEVYKRAVRKLREVLGDDVFYLGIALMGINYGVVDGMRLTLDNGPRWEESDPFALIGSGGSFKGTVRTGARRYYLHNRVWVTHNDLLFFRTVTSQPDPPVTLDEAVTLASFMGLTGSIVKFGEDLRTLSPEQIQVWRKLLPIYPATARPLDLFTRMYPEQWLLPIHGTLPGADASWTVLGLLDWGKNYDYTADEVAQKLPDAARSYSLDLAKIGLEPSRDYLASEFWSEKFLGVVHGTLTSEVAAHGHAVIALRAVTGHPQLLGHNRHFTQGATDLVEESWDDKTRTLRLVFDLDQGAADAVPFEYRFRVYVPAGYTLTTSDVGSGVVSQEGEVLSVKLTPKTAGRVTLTLAFGSS